MDFFERSERWGAALARNVNGLAGVAACALLALTVWALAPTTATAVGRMPAVTAPALAEVAVAEAVLERGNDAYVLRVAQTSGKGDRLETVRSAPVRRVRTLAIHPRVARKQPRLSYVTGLQAKQRRQAEAQTEAREQRARLDRLDAHLTLVHLGAAMVPQLRVFLPELGRW